MAEDYDLVILGGGTGGYAAAIRASQLGLKTAVVENEKLGGTCLHSGCIPSKALLRSAEVFKQTKEADRYGVSTGEPVLNFKKVQERKNQIIDRLHEGVKGLMKKGKIDIFKGYGRILGPSIFSPVSGTISVEYENGEENEILIPKNVIIATGSQPRTLPGLEVDGKYVMNSDHALEMEHLPQSILIIGGGVIGIEWASMLCDFGVDVTVVEAQEQILPAEDHQVAKEMERSLAKRGVTFLKQARVNSESLQIDSGVSIQIEANHAIQTYSAEKILVSVGREANITNIGLENTDIEIENRVIQTNAYYQTKESHIYAIGDVIGGMQLAHAAQHEGFVAVEHIADKNPMTLDNNSIPSCVYSSPESARIGMTEHQAADLGFDIKIGKFPFKSVGKALIYGETEGFVKIIADKKTDDLLGIHMIGPNVTDLVSEAGIAKLLDATPWEIASFVHPHPSLSESIAEAALAVDGKQIHG